MLENFIYTKKKSLFEKALNSGEVLNEAIIFIEDTKEIWNHGTYFDGSTFDPTDIETSIQNILDTKADKTEIPTKVSELENDVPYAVDNVMPENGVYIIDVNGNLYDKNTSGVSDAIGVVLKTDALSIIIAKDEWCTDNTDYDGGGTQIGDGPVTTPSGTQYCSAWGGYDTTVSGCTITRSKSTAITDMNGSANTDAIIAALSGTSDSKATTKGYTGAPAAEYCRAYSPGYKDGQWYLPSAGEMNAIVTNQTDIDTALSSIGGESLLNNDYTWTSTQYSADSAWYYYQDNFSNLIKYGDSGVRPVCAFEVKSLKERVSEIESSVQKILEEYGLDELNAILVDTGDVASDPEINDYVSPTELQNTLTNYATKSEIPTTTSQLTNDSGFITDVSDKQDVIDDLATIRSGASAGATAVQPSSLSAVATSGDYNDLSNKPTIPSAVTESTVSGWGFTKNTGTITGITMNGTSKGTSGVVDLGTVITAHQDISGKQDTLVSGTNIKTVNGTSLLGSGDIAIESGGKILISNETATTKAISPNVFYVWGTMSSLVITLTTPTDSSIYNEYMFQFISGTTATTFSLPSDVVILNNTTIEANKTYQVSIVKGLAVVCGFDILAQGCCFVAGTKVTMADGTTKNIEDIKRGESVLSYNVETNENYETIVKNLIVNPSAINMARVTLEDGTSVTMNEYHPLLTQDGWKSLTNYQNYPTLTEADSLLKEDLSYGKISSIERWAEPNPVITYHLDVRDTDEVIDIDTNDNFFVNGICAHNIEAGHY